MFENLFYQDTVKQYLTECIVHSALPQVLHFTGPRHSGKLTAALEIIRSMNCKHAVAAWKCSCASCLQQRTLSSPHTKLLGRRYFKDEIAAVMQSKRLQNSSRIQLRRNIQKLICRFDSVLWEEQKTTHKKALKCIEDLKSGFESHSSDGDTQIINAVKQLEDMLPISGVSIDMVRKLVYWTQSADRTKNKFIIMENIEYINLSSANALLKILEDPPPKTYFILLSVNKDRIIQTLRSRMKTTYFKNRSKEEHSEILKRVFHTQSDFTSIQEYFDSCSSDLTQIETYVQLLLQFLNNGEMTAYIKLLQHIQQDRTKLKSIIRNCLQQLEEGKITNIEDMHVQKQLETIQYRMEVYNIPVQSALENALM